jgi:hypothetical protein
LFSSLINYYYFAQGWFFSPAPYGALTPLWAGVSPQTVDFNGKVRAHCVKLRWFILDFDPQKQYLIPWAREGKMRSEAQDPQLGEKLWTWLEAETKE